MSLISRLYQAVQSWSRRRDGGPRAPRARSSAAGVALEQLDHRQLLSVNFTGNVATDLPAPHHPRVVLPPAHSSVHHGLKVDYQQAPGGIAASVAPSSEPVATTVKIQAIHAAALPTTDATAPSPRPFVTIRAQRNVDAFVRGAGAIDLATGLAIPSAGVSKWYAREPVAFHTARIVRINGAVNLSSNTPVGPSAF